jgi:hypothetical protein
MAGGLGGRRATSTTDDRRPTTDDRRPTTDDRRPTTDDRTEDKMGDGRMPSSFVTLLSV